MRSTERRKLQLQAPTHGNIAQIQLQVAQPVIQQIPASDLSQAGKVYLGGKLHNV